MRPALLLVDNAFDQQPRLKQQVAAAGGVTLDCRSLGPALRLWSRAPALDQLRDAVREAFLADHGPLVTFSGSGDFHHITPILLERALAATNCEPVTLVHFDNHPDWVRFAGGLHCGSWVGKAARLPGVAKVLTVGVCSDDIDAPQRKGADLKLLNERRVELYPYRVSKGRTSFSFDGQDWPSIEAMGEADFVEFLVSRIGTKDIYITIDKDVLRPEDAATNWDQGRTSLAFLMAMLTRIGADHRLIGADVVGDWSPADYGGLGMASLLKRGEALLDQPWRRPSAGARAAAGAVNLAMLDLLTELGR